MKSSNYEIKQMGIILCIIYIQYIYKTNFKHLGIQTKVFKIPNLVFKKLFILFTQGSIKLNKSDSKDICKVFIK